MDEQEVLIKINTMTCDELKILPVFIYVSGGDDGEKYFSEQLANILSAKFEQQMLLEYLPYELENPSLEEYYDDLFTVILNNKQSEYFGVLNVDLSSWEKNFRDPTLYAFMTKIFRREFSWLKDAWIIIKVNEEGTLLNVIEDIAPAITVKSQIENDKPKVQEVDVVLSERFGKECVELLRAKCRNEYEMERCAKQLMFEQDVTISNVNKLIERVGNYGRERRIGF